MDKSDDLEMVNASMVPPLMEAVLIDYARNVPDAREAEVLNAMTTIIHKLHVCSLSLIAWLDDWEFPLFDGPAHHILVPC